MDSEGLLWRVEEACLNAWPALRQVLLGGWVLRFSGGLTRRANSANPRGFHRIDSETLINGCEQLYQHHRQPTIFRLPSLIGPEIDERLAARGYSSEGLSLVLYAALEDVPVVRDPAVTLRSRPTAGWSTAMAALQQHTKQQAVLYRRIVAALALPAAFAMLVEDDEIAALAFGAIHDGVICYESVVTDPRRLRRGYARRVVATLAAWARDQEAVAACLEVEAANTPALTLYARLGFREIYRYHYRRQPHGHRR